MKRSTIRNSILLVFALVAFYVLSAPGALAAPQKVCIKEDGSLIAKRRCKVRRNETQVSLTDISAMVEGLPGPQGPEGPQGPAGVVGLEAVESSETVSVAGDGIKILKAVCPEGKIAISGACRANVSRFRVYTSWAVDEGSAWECRWSNGDSIGRTSLFLVTAYCVSENIL